MVPAFSLWAKLSRNPVFRLRRQTCSILSRKLLRIQNRTYLQPGTNWDGKLGYYSDYRQLETARIPKSNRMPDAPHSVKVETQVVDCVEDLGKYLVGRIKVPQICS